MLSCEGLGKGGIQDVMMKIARKTSENNVEMDMLLFTNEKRFYDEEAKKYCRIFRIPPRFHGKIGRHLEYYFQGRWYYREISKILRTYGPYDVIHCNNYFMAAWALKAAKDNGVPVRIAHAHNPKQIGSREYFIRNSYDQYLKRLIKTYATVLIGCSKQAAEYMFDDDKRTLVIPNSISIQREKQGTSSFHVLSESDIRLLHVGRFSSQKNQKMCIKLLKQLIKENIGVKLTLMGNIVGEDGQNEYNKCIELIQENGLSEFIEFKSGDEDVYEEMRQNDIFLMPSVYEGFGIVALEAQSMGMMCILSDRVPSEVNAGNCFFCSIDNEEKWIFTIKQLISKGNDPRIIPDMQRFSTESILPQYFSVYNGELR